VKSTRFSLLALAALLAALLITSCNNSFGVFDSVRKDVAQSTSSDFKETTVVDFAQTTNNYFAVMSAVYSRPVGGGSWRSVSLPGVGTAYSCTGIASDGGSNIYISATSNDTTKPTSNIYRSPDGGSTWTTYYAGGMNLVVSGDEYDQIDGIWLAGPSGSQTLYAQKEYFKTTGTTADPDTGYALYVDNGSGSFTAIGTVGNDGAASSSHPPRFTDVAYATGPHYYCAKGSTVYDSGASSFAGASSSAAPDTVLGMKESISMAGTILAWTASNIYRLPTGFTSISSNLGLSTDNVISDVQEVPVTGGWHLLVGTGTDGVSYTANGYRESGTSTDGSSYDSFVAGSSGTVAVSGNNSSFDTLFASKPVTKFYLDSSSTPAPSATWRLFACIAASGLTTSSYGLVATTASTADSGTTWAWYPDGWSAE